MQKWGVATFLLLYSSLQSHLLCLSGKQGSLYYFLDFQSCELAIQDFHPHPHPSLVLKPDIICTFLIHSGSLQKMFAALFNLVWNTQKSKSPIFFECQGQVLKRFLSIEKVLEKIREEQPLMHCLIVFLHMFEIKVSHFY